MPPTKRKDSKKDAVVNAMMKHWEKHRWMKLRTALHLQSEEAADRLAALLTMHLLLDRAVTAVISARFVDPRTFTNLKDVEGVVGRIFMNRRIELMKVAHLVSNSCAADVKAVNDVRNKFAHFHPEKSGRGSEVGNLPELSSMKDFERCMQRGERALRELTKNIVHMLEHPATAICHDHPDVP